MTGEARGRERGASAPRAALAALLVVLGSASASQVEAGVVTLTADRDNTLFQDAAGALSSGAGPSLFAGRNSQGLVRRALVHFDVAAHVPPNALITDAVLTLHVSNVSEVTTRSFALHRALLSWGEGTSISTGGSGAAAAAGDATWLHAFWPDGYWSIAGGDFASVPSGAQSVGDVGSYTWRSSPMVADVQAWLVDPSGNHGWILLGDESVSGTARRFDARENAEEVHRPALTLTYAVPAAVADAGPGLELAPCRPHPASARVRFAFAQPAAAHARIDLLDAGGRHVATVLEGSLGPGRHEVAWDARALRGGVYFYRLILEGSVRATRRLVILD